MPQLLQPVGYVYALDCPDPLALAEFYAGILGWKVTFDETADPVHWVSLRAEGEVGQVFGLGFQRVENNRAPQWPNGSIPQQAHLDLYVKSVEEGAEIAVRAGAVRHRFQPSENGAFIVLIDPAGHPFCLCQV